MNTIKIILLIFVAMVINSCNEKHNKKTINSFKAIIDNNLGKKIKLPDSLILHKPFLNSNNQFASDTKMKVYSHIDASCGTCIESLKAWNNLIPEFNKQKVKVYLICSSDDRFDLLKYYFESKEIDNFSYNLYFDYNNDYLIKNEFMFESRNFETVLVDENGTILVIGNPNYSKKIKEMYFNLINN